MITITKFLKSIFIIGSLLIVLASTSSSQELGIIAVVNDEAITAFDLSERLDLAISTSGLENNKETRNRIAPQILRSLIDESLQNQELKRLELEVSNLEISNAIGTLEERNGIPPGGFREALENQGLNIQTLIKQISAEIAWNKILRREIFSKIQVSEDQINEMESRINLSKGKFRLRLSEIFLAIDNPELATTIHNEALRILADLNEGADFGGMARQFSQGASTYQSGNLGWVLEDQLMPEIANEISNLKSGQLSNIISVPGGYYIIFLHERRTIGGIDPLNTVVHLKQVVITISKNATELEISNVRKNAELLSMELNNCQKMDEKIDEINNSESGDVGTLRIGDMPKQFQDIILPLKVGVASSPIESEVDFRIYMLCDRIEPNPDIPTRDEIRESIWNQQVEMLTRRLMRDLRRSSVIDVR